MILLFYLCVIFTCVCFCYIIIMLITVSNEIFMLLSSFFIFLLLFSVEYETVKENNDTDIDMLIWRMGRRR